MALYIFATALLLTIVSIAFYASPLLRNIENLLPDYIPEEEPDNLEELQPVPVA